MGSRRVQKPERSCPLLQNEAKVIDEAAAALESAAK
jgi:hypothetical protein